MWIAYVILSICVTVASIASIPLVTKRFAQFKLQQSIEITLRQFQDIANAYTENGTPEELASMIEDLEEVMEELKFLEKND